VEARGDNHLGGQAPSLAMKRKTHTWGSIFRNALKRGYDHGYAAFLADAWEKRKAKTNARLDENHMH